MGMFLELLREGVRRERDAAGKRQRQEKRTERQSWEIRRREQGQKTVWERREEERE